VEIQVRLEGAAGACLRLEMETTAPSIVVRRSDSRGHFNFGWLDTYHTFSFGNYRDPEHMHFRQLRVMNEDVVTPGMGFDMHGHRDMEIITYVLAGQIEHRDSLGNHSILRAGELQRMTAGRGIEHAETNPSSIESLHLYQIWIFPERKGLDPGYEQKAFLPEARQERLQRVVSPDGRDGSLRINQDVSIYLATLAAGQSVTHPLAAGRSAWVQMLRGQASVAGQAVRAGDGVAISGKDSVAIGGREGAEDAEVMLFDLS